MMFLNLQFNCNFNLAFFFFSFLVLFFAGQEGPVTLAIREAVQKDMEDPAAGVLVSVSF